TRHKRICRGLLAKFDQASSKQSNKSQDSICRIPMMRSAPLVKKKQQIHTLLAESMIQSMEHAFPITNRRLRNIALGMHIVAVTAKRNQIEGCFSPKQEGEIYSPAMIQPYKGYFIAGNALLVHSFSQ